MKYDSRVPRSRIPEWASRQRHQLLEVKDLVTLTRAEEELLVLYGLGLTRDLCAKVLHRSPRTVDKHRNNIMRKLKIHTTAELCLLSARLRLAEYYEYTFYEE